MLVMNVMMGLIRHQGVSALTCSQGTALELTARKGTVLMLTRCDPSWVQPRGVHTVGAPAPMLSSSLGALLIRMEGHAVQDRG